MRWTGDVDCIGRGEMRSGCWWESEKERNHYEDLDVGGRIIIN
jgi:hypothetical protein